MLRPALRHRRAKEGAEHSFHIRSTFVPHSFQHTGELLLLSRARGVHAYCTQPGRWTTPAHALLICAQWPLVCAQHCLSHSSPFVPAFVPAFVPVEPRRRWATATSSRPSCVLELVCRLPASTLQPATPRSTGCKVCVLRADPAHVTWTAPHNASAMHCEPHLTAPLPVAEVSQLAADAVISLQRRGPSKSRG